VFPGQLQLDSDEQDGFLQSPDTCAPFRLLADVLQNSPPLQSALLPQVPPQLFGVPVGVGVNVGVAVGVGVGLPVGVAVGVAVGELVDLFNVNVKPQLFSVFPAA
jgi:hypothetical protein